MSSASFDPIGALSELLQQLPDPSSSPGDRQIILSGASGRYIARFRRGTGSYIGMGWSASRADNAAYLPAAALLKEAGVHVPNVLLSRDEGDGNGVCLVQDLGDTRLLDLKGESWRVQRTAYKQAIGEALRLHRSAANPGIVPPFDESLYRWEQEYFAEHYLGGHLHRSGSDLTNRPEMKRMAAKLASLPRCMVHRDLQSQNIMLHGGRAWLIDFQGMRPGLPEYDAASLIFDPYMDLPFERKMKLTKLWETCGGRRLDRDIFPLCALQRIMQALGAYAKLWHGEHRKWYRLQLDSGLRSLEQIAALPQLGEQSQSVLSCLRDAQIIKF